MNKLTIAKITELVAKAEHLLHGTSTAQLPIPVEGLPDLVSAIAKAREQSGTAPGCPAWIVLNNKLICGGEDESLTISVTISDVPEESCFMMYLYTSHHHGGRDPYLYLHIGSTHTNITVFGTEDQRHHVEILLAQDATLLAPLIDVVMPLLGGYTQTLLAMHPDGEIPLRLFFTKTLLLRKRATSLSLPAWLQKQVTQAQERLRGLQEAYDQRLHPIKPDPACFDDGHTPSREATRDGMAWIAQHLEEEQNARLPVPVSAGT